MKFSLAALFLILFIFHYSFLQAQGTDMLDQDFDSLFDEPLPDPEPAVTESGASGGEAGASIKIRSRGFLMDASYYFYGGFSPGWSEAPWYPDGQLNYAIGAEMSAALSLDFQISESLRIKNAFSFAFPGFAFTVSELFLDYNLLDLVFFRLGKYNHYWGISPNYAYADLLSRVPAGTSGGDSYYIRGNIPVGVGGLEFLAMTRSGIGDLNNIELKSLGFGGKYDLGFNWGEINIGVFYMQQMATRGFASLKTTIFETEVYAQGLLAVPQSTDDLEVSEDIEFSASLALIRGFFDDKLGIGVEFFYSGEKDAAWYNPATNLTVAEVKPFIEGLNTALNISYEPGGLLGLQLFVQCLYASSENTAQLVPGFSIDPFAHVKVSMAVPMALGSREGTYYRNNADRENRPFSVILLVTINGSYSYAKYE
jgi:hypothetical protein